MHAFLTFYLKNKNLVNGILEIFCSYDGTITSNSVQNLLAVGQILERLRLTVLSLYGTAVTVPIGKWCHFRRDIAFCRISCNCIK